MIGRFRDMKSAGKRNLEKVNLWTFYRDHVLIRLLDKEHLMKEIKHHLLKKVKSKCLNSQEFDYYLEKAENNLATLDFLQG